MGLRTSLSNVATISAIVGVSTVSSIYLLYYIRRRLEDKEAFNALLSQLTSVEIPITKLTFFDLAENRTQDMIALEEKYKVRVKLQPRSSAESGTESIVVTGFKCHVDPASLEVKSLVAEVSAIVTCLIKMPQHVTQLIDLEKVIAVDHANSNQGYDLTAVVNTSKSLDAEGNSDREILELCLTGTQSQVNFTRELIISSAVQFYQQEFEVPACVERAVGSAHDVYVSAVTSLNKFWVQVVDHTAHSLDELQDALCAQSRDLLPFTSDVTQVMCAAPYVEDPSSYYRAKVLTCHPNPPNDVDNRLCTVEYVDYGDESQVLYAHLRQLKPEFCTLPAQALECCLHGATPDTKENNSEIDWQNSAAVLDKFKHFVHFNEWVPMKMLIVDKLESEEQQKNQTGCKIV